MIKILVDSSSDYSPEEIRQKGYLFVPVTISIGENSYVDGVDLERNAFFELLIHGSDFPKTAQPSPQAFLEHFQKIKRDGDEVICILLSSELSGTCQSALLAKNMVEYDGIHIVDSLSATFCIKILADHAASLIRQGLGAARIVAELERLKSRVKVVAALNTLEYLQKGGRIGKATATIGEMANIKPVITVTKEGGIGVLGKCIGKNKAISFIVKHLEELSLDTAFPVYSIFSYGTDNCEKFEEKLAEKNIPITRRLQIGATIGSHIGPEAFGLIFVEK